MDHVVNSEIDTLARELAARIESCESRRQYMEIKAKISENNFLAFQIREFKRAHVEYQLKVLNNDPPSFEEERHVSKLYADLMLNTDAREFLANENAMLIMMARLHDVLNASCGVDLDF